MRVRARRQRVSELLSEPLLAEVEARFVWGELAKRMPHSPGAQY
jgi:hypothetical protein